ncbi:twin-arginine translocation signal domain-containing protein [Streptomyces caniscabiei]|uniref:twin-arginine translocation signal domain-containing protein n=1 Tax=Streptomyces caniscabiei TaxID=2746961 RepID=UPI0029A964AF|nr:twin-arginine translocation signal domain-containing protein [Streptomyces caniscabiei]MDX2776519.1 twin-arginine translocation signal domain-containing protein [Streptomyces caniscabiei]
MSLNIQKSVNQLMEKEMDRRDFLKHVGIGFVALTGIAAIIKTLNTMNGTNETVGYGSGAYGGNTPERGSRS